MMNSVDIGSSPKHWRAKIMVMGAEVWACPHDHLTQTDANQCAKKKLTLLMDYLTPEEPPA